MAQRIQQAPPRRRPTAIKANPTQAPTPLDLSPPPITEGVDAVVGWINRLNLQTIDLAQHQPQKHKALQVLVAAFGRCRATARDVALLLQAREQRDRVPAAGAYATEPPLTDGLAMPLWHAFELVRLLYLVAQAPDVDKEDVAAIQTRIRHHVSGVTVREADATADFKRRHRIGSDVAGAVAGYAQIQAQLEKEALTAGDAEDARDDLVAFGRFMKSDFLAPWHIHVVADALMRAERREIRGLIINMPPRRGKPVWEEELILCGDGSRRPLKDIVVGDEVIGDSGKPRKVEKVFIQGELPCVEIETRYGRVVRMALDHPVLTTEGWKEAGQIKPSDVLAVSHSQKVSEAPSQYSDADFALAGYLLGDGSVNETAQSCSASFTNADPEVIADFTKAANQLGFDVKHVSKYTYSLSCATGKQGYTPRHWLRDTKVFGSSYTKRVPAWVFRAPLRQIAIYLGAYFACDGSAEQLGDHGYRLTFNSVSWEILEAVQHLLLRFGIHSSLRLKNGKYNGRNHVSFRTTIYNEHNVALFRKHIPVAGKRGKLIQAATPRQLEFPGQWFGDEVTKVSHIGKLPCRCLTVAVDHTFTVHDIVVHNSVLASELFLSWYLGRHPTHDVILGTLSQTFADSMGRKVRNMIQSSEYRRVFPGVNVATDSSAAAVFEIIEEGASARQRRGNFKAFGREAGVTGSGSSVLLIDDLLSELDAYSATERNKLIDNLIAFRTRLAPDAIWIVINTRYHEDDVVGVVKRDFADDREWTVITLPEFAEADEEWVVTTPATARRPAQRRVYTRKAGDVLWPDRFSAESSEQLKAALLKVAPHKWWGQFQCRPVPASGAMVDVSWFRRYDYADVMSIVKQAARVVVSVDCGGVKLHSRGSGAYGSRTAITVWAEWEDGRLYLIDVIASPWIYPDMIQAVKDACANWKPTDLLIENKAAGVELIRDLHEHRNWVQTPITPIDPFGPKETRMSVATPQIRAGQVYIPAQGACADIAAVRCAAPAWLEEFLTEMGHFPMGSRNDITDSTSQLLNWRRDSPVWSNFSQVTASSPAKDALMAAIAGPFGRRGGLVGVRPTMRIGSPRRPG